MSNVRDLSKKKINSVQKWQLNESHFGGKKICALHKTWKHFLCKKNKKYLKRINFIQFCWRFFLFLWVKRWTVKAALFYFKQHHMTLPGSVVASCKRILHIYLCEKPQKLETIPTRVKKNVSLLKNFWFFFFSK